MKDGYWCSKHCSKGRLANWAKVGVDQHLQINIFTLSLFLSQIKDSTISFTLTFQIILFLLNYRVSWQIEHYTCESIYLFFIYTFTVHFMKWGFGILIYTYNTCSNNYCYILFFIVQLQGMLANWARQTDRWMNLLKLNPPASAGLKECTNVGTNLSGAFWNKSIWGIFWIGLLDTKFHELCIHPHLGYMHWYLIFWIYLILYLILYNIFLFS